MSGESAQDIEVSITAPNRSFHATVIASDVSWQDRPAGVLPSEQPRRPIWSSAFGDSIDTVDTMDSEMSGDPMINSTTSLSQDSLYDGYAVEFIASSKDIAEGLSIMNGGVTTGAAAVSSSAEGAEAASAAFTASSTASDAVSTSIEMRPTGFAETDRGSISCEMITPKPVLVGNGHVPSGDAATVTPSSTTVTTSSSSTTTVTSTEGDSAVTTHTQQAPGSTFQMTAMESHEEHAEAPETPRDRAMSLHERSLLAHDLHALASTMDTIKDENEVHVGSSSPEEKEVKEEKRVEETYTSDRRESLTGVPISATTYVAPSQPTIFEAAESAAAAVAAAAEAAPEASEPSPYLRKLLDAQEATRQLMALLGESTQMLGALPTAKKDEEKEKEKEEQPASDAAPAAEAASAASFTSQSSSSMTTFSSSSSTAASAAAASETSTTTNSQATTTAPVTSTEIPVSVWQQPEEEKAAPVASTEIPVSVWAPATGGEQTADGAQAAVPATPVTPTAAVPASPAFEITSRPIDVTFDDGKTVPPAFSLAPAAEPASPISRGPASPAPATPTAAAAPTSTETPVSVWPQPEEEKTAAAATEIPVTVSAPTTGESTQASDAATTEIPVSVWAPQTEETKSGGETAQVPAAATPESASPAVETQNASICSALESLAANMTTVTTRNEESSSSTTTTTAVDTTSAPGGVTSDVPVTLGTPVLLEPAVSPKVSISEEPSSVDSAPPTPTPASLLHDSTVASLSIGLPTPRPTPEPDQERFVTNAEQSEATMTKSSFSLSATTTTSSSSTDTTAASTDYVLPATSVVLQAEDSTASTPAAVPAPTLTPAAVDVPVDIVRHLDDPAAWHSAPAGADVADGKTVPIAVAVESRGPPPLAREVPAAEEEAQPPRGPPPLAKESEEHHELSRSVMVERRVLSPDSALHSAQQPQQQTTITTPYQQEPAGPVAAPMETTSAPAAPTDTAPAVTSTEIPVTISQQPEQQVPAAETASTPAQPEPAMPTVTSTEIPVTVQSADETKPAEPAPKPASDAPLSVVLQPSLSQQEKEQSDATKDASSVDIPVTVVKEESEQPKEATSAVSQQPSAEETPAVAQQAPVLACELQQQPAAVTGEQPVASAAQQEQQAASAAPADAAAPTTSPTTAHAPMSLESTFQITPSEEEFAQAPAMPRDRAMSIHERSLLAHESSGFQPGLEPLPENINDDGEVHVASAIDRRRASLAPGELGEAPTSTFQAPSTSCLFTVDEATPREESEATEAAPASTASPSGESTTTMASSTGADAVIDVTAPETPVEAAKPPAQLPGGVKWLTESESPDSPAQTTVVAAAPPVQQPTAETGQSTPAQESAASAPTVDTSAHATAVPATTVAVDAPPPTPKTPLGVSWITEPTGTTATTEPTSVPAGTTEPAQVPAQTPKTPTGVNWVTEPATAAPQTPKSPAAPAATWATEPAPTGTTDASVPPQTPKTPTGVTWISEPAAPAQSVPEAQAPPQTPKAPTGVTLISEPAAPATPTSPALEISSRPLDITIDGGSAAPAATPVDQPAAPPTPKTPSGVSWITEPAATSGTPDVAAAPAATTAAPSVINITAPSTDSGDKAGAAPPLTPTSPGIKWASDSERVGGNVVADGAAPPPAAESTFVVNAPWEGADQAPPKTPDADGVTWITEEPTAAAPRPPLTRSESTRSERDPSTATDITVREATPQRRTLVPSASVEEDNLTNGVTQEALGTKVRKLSWADQQPSQAEDSFSAAIDDYEKKLNETTAQTKELVDLLCQTGNQITENSIKMSDVFSDAVQAGVRSMLDQERRDRAAAALSPIAENGENISRSPPPQLIGGALPPNVESVIVSSPELKYVTGSLVLDNANILVTDDEAGLFLFTLDSTVVKHVSNAAWKHPGSPVIFKDRLKSYILILMDCKDEEDGSWVRHIVKFSENLDYMEKVECPKWIRERTIISDRLAVNRYENIYYCANGEIFSGLYELAPTGKWTELLYRQSESFIDMLAFAIIGPIQQILIVEGRRDHVLLCSIRESECVEARRMAICERPGALARDESGRLFVMNRAQAAVQIVDTRVWAACRNMALVDKFVPHFSAAFGMLVIPQKRAVKVHKYSFEWDD